MGRGGGGLAVGGDGGAGCATGACAPQEPGRQHQLACLLTRPELSHVSTIWHAGLPVSPQASALNRRKASALIRRQASAFDTRFSCLASTQNRHASLGSLGLECQESEGTGIEVRY